MRRSSAGEDFPASLTVAFRGNEDVGVQATNDRKGRLRVFLVVGGAIGLAVGILVSVAIDVPFAPEVGLLVGALAGWLLQRRLAAG
jgi:hypothetical protein